MGYPLDKKDLKCLVCDIFLQDGRPNSLKENRSGNKNDNKHRNKILHFLLNIHSVEVVSLFNTHGNSCELLDEFEIKYYLKWRLSSCVSCK